MMVRGRAVLAAISVLLAPVSVAAQTIPAANAGSETLRPLCTDRPTKSTSPCTVDAGHFQLESDLFNVTVDRGGGQTTTTWLATNPTLKYGLTDRLDVEVNMAPYVSVWFATGHPTPEPMPMASAICFSGPSGRRWATGEGR